MSGLGDKILLYAKIQLFQQRHIFKKFAYSR